MTFKSDVGIFYNVILLMLFTVTGYALVDSYPNPGLTILPPMLITVVFGCGLPVWLLFATDYTITGSALKIRCGPFKWTVERREIHSITPSRNLISSPALSLNRLDIKYGHNRHILVSPRDRKGFYEALGFTPPP